ncbi:MAG TPA: hypothetical protein VJ914_22305 [Pseudonocardiaceae bacterium]|nr:hypothetical protein [Pseudonocardiaceae bacterium]
MADTMPSRPARPLQFLEPGAAGYCDPVTGLWVLRAAVPELRGDPEARTFPGPAEKVDTPGPRPIGD